ncbi:MAG: hypothetical protein AAGC60_05825 [Acidobacteriota bacterium]
MHRSAIVFLTTISHNILRIVGWLVLILGTVIIGCRIVEQWPMLGSLDVAELWQPLLGMVLGALVVHLGPAFLQRLKKVGPVEFYAREVQEVLPALRAILERAPRLERTNGPRVDVVDKSMELTKEEEYFVSKANALVDHLEFTSLRESPLAEKREIHELLSRVAGIALDQGELPRAIDRLELLLDISSGSYEPEETWNRLATAEVELGKGLDGSKGSKMRQRRRQLLESGILSAKRAIKAQRKAGFDDDPRPHFQRAFAHHLLGEMKTAARLYRGVLAVEAHHAPSRYNLAAVLVRCDELEAAAAALMELEMDSIEVERTVAHFDQDDELRPLLLSAHGGKVEAHLVWLRELVQGDDPQRIASHQVTSSGRSSPRKRSGEQSGDS